MLLGITITLIFRINGGFETVEHAASNQARLIMLQDSLKMIVEKTWLG